MVVGCLSYIGFKAEVYCDCKSRLDKKGEYIVKSYHFGGLNLMQL